MTDSAPRPFGARVDRRSLFATTAAAGTLGLGACASRPPRPEDGEDCCAPTIANGATVLFQGDSITDSGRDREKGAAPNDHAGFGNGYAWLAAAGTLAARPNDGLAFFNRGISGHKVFQLANRWDADCIDLAPDVVSILIGVNDIWHERNGNYDGTVEVYERDYAALLARTRDALPSAKLVVCEPFVLRCGAVDDSWFPEFDGYRAAARRVADGAGAIWVPFHTLFEEASRLAPPEYWAADGVHPSGAGAALMAQCWQRSVG